MTSPRCGARAGTRDGQPCRGGDIDWHARGAVVQRAIVRGVETLLKRAFEDLATWPYTQHEVIARATWTRSRSGKGLTLSPQTFCQMRGPHPSRTSCESP